LVIIIYSNFKFNEHIKYITDRSTKLINALSKSARINWGLKHEALRTIYKWLDNVWSGLVYVQAWHNLEEAWKQE